MASGVSGDPVGANIPAELPTPKVLNNNKVFCMAPSVSNMSIVGLWLSYSLIRYYDRSFYCVGYLFVSY